MPHPAGGGRVLLSLGCSGTWGRGDVGLRRTEYGLVTLIDPGADKPLAELPTLCCVHCGGHWLPRPGSGNVRGWCGNCAGPVCGPGCAACVPAEVLLENIEEGRPLDFRPVIVPAGG